MATVMSWGNSEGTKGRCDAKCHAAAGPHCDCMCGGRYHGKAREEGGLERAIREHGEEVLEAARERARREGVTLEAKSVAELLETLSGSSARRVPATTQLPLSFAGASAQDR